MGWKYFFFIVFAAKLYILIVFYMSSTCLYRIFAETEAFNSIATVSFHINSSSVTPWSD